jgi:hypothetical protein
LSFNSSLFSIIFSPENQVCEVNFFEALFIGKTGFLMLICTHFLTACGEDCEAGKINLVLHYNHHPQLLTDTSSKVYFFADLKPLTCFKFLKF